MLHRLWELDAHVRRAYARFDFQDAVRPVAEFCSTDLSAFYIDVRRDSLYCDRPDALRRRACRTVLNHVFERLTAWLAPVLCFTMEEAWATLHPQGCSNAARVISTPAGYGLTHGARRWSCCAIRSGSPLPSSGR